jgi:hypothetical protein
MIVNKGFKHPNIIILNKKLCRYKPREIMPYTIVTIQNFELFRPSLAAESLSANISHSSERKKEYFIHSYHEEDEVDCYHHFPFILDSKGAPFYNGNKFILHMMEKNSEQSNLVDKTTYEGYAKDVRDFMNFAEDEYDYLVSKRRISTPIARFRRELENKIALGGSAQYSKQKIGRVVLFYRFLVDTLGYYFDSCPWWEDIEGTKHYRTTNDISFSKPYLSSTVQQIITPPKQTNDEDSLEGVVKDDGETLRPLPYSESRIVIKALNEIGNIEMTLIHYLVLFTGARTQTACTLRQIDFARIPKDNEQVIVIGAGCGEFPDSKGNRPFKVKMPVMIYNMVRTYIKSKRAVDRYSGANFIFDDPQSQYVFITTQGNPYYTSKSDPTYLLQKTPPVGKSVMEFVSGKLRPKMEKLGFENPKKRFRTHFLRATYGMNRLDCYIRSMPPNLSEKAQAAHINNSLTRTMKDMNHKNIKTTMLYLNLRSNEGIVHEANDEYEKHLVSLLELNND